MSKPILFNFLNISDSLKIKNAKSTYLRGLGDGDSIEAFISSNNILKIGDVTKLNQDLFAVYNANLNFSPKVGVPVHGIIGYDILKDFVVEINYSKKYLRFTKPEDYRYSKCDRCEVFDLEFHKKKPYINISASFKNNEVPIKLLIDSGSSDALWLFEDRDAGLICKDTYFEDFLGHGLSGSVYGRRSKVDKVLLKSFKLENVNVAYPDSTSISLAKRFEGRNGSLAGDILKRFNVIFDYRRAIIILKKNENFKNKFLYNKSGLELEHSGMRVVKIAYRKPVESKGFQTNNNAQNSTRIILNTEYKVSLKPAYTIAELREGSPAKKSGLQLGDLVLSINGKSTINIVYSN